MNFKSFGFTRFRLALLLSLFGVVAAIDMSQTAQNNSELHKCKQPNTKLHEITGLFGVQYLCTPITSPVASLQMLKRDKN